MANETVHLPLNHLPDPLDGRLRRLFGNQVNQEWDTVVEALLLSGFQLGLGGHFRAGITWQSSGGETEALRLRGLLSLEYEQKTDARNKGSLLQSMIGISGLGDFLPVLAGLEPEMAKTYAEASDPGVKMQVLLDEGEKAVQALDELPLKHGVEVIVANSEWHLTFDEHYTEDPFNLPVTLRETEPAENPWDFTDPLFRAMLSEGPFQISIALRSARHSGSGTLNPEYFCYPAKVLKVLRESLRTRYGNEDSGDTGDYVNASEEIRQELRRALEEQMTRLRKQPHFLGSVRVFGPTAVHARMLGARIGQSLFGAGNFQVLELPLNEEPCLRDPLYWADKLPDLVETEEPKKLILQSKAQLPYFVSFETASCWFNLPKVSDRYLQSIPNSTDPDPADERTCLEADDLDRHRPVQLPAKALTRHAFVTGMTGSGKTTTVHSLLINLWEKQNIPFLVLEPAKREYRKLKTCGERLKEDMVVLTPGRENLMPLKLNPLRPLDLKAPVQEHISMVEMIFRAALPMPPPLPFLFTEALDRVYRERGWRFFDSNDGKADVPTIPDLVEAMRSVMEAKGYDKEIRSNLETMLETRFGSLTRGYIGRVFDSTDNIPDIPELLKLPVLVELASLNRDEANLITLFLLSAVRRIRDQEGPSKKLRHLQLRHLLVLEEAHNLLEKHAGESSSADGSTYDPKAEASRFIEGMLAEVRALGQGMLVADQSPSVIPASVIRNTRTKIVHQITDPADREAMAASLGLDPAKEEDIAHLIPREGEAVFITDGYVRPTRIQVQVPKHYPFHLHLPDEDPKLNFGKIEAKWLTKMARADAIRHFPSIRSDYERLLKTADLTAKEQDLVVSLVVSAISGTDEDKPKRLSQSLSNALAPRAKDALTEVDKTLDRLSFRSFRSHHLGRMSAGHSLGDCTLQIERHINFLSAMRARMVELHGVKGETK